MKEFLAHTWFCLCAVAFILSACICIGACEAQQYHVALPWGLSAISWAINVWQWEER